MKSSIQKTPSNIASLESEAFVLRELGRANLVIDQFIRSCSHSMRGPIKSIRGLLNLMKDDPYGKEVTPDMLIKFIEDSADKMETMLDELEQFMVNSMRASKSKEVDINELVRQVVATMQKEIKKQSIELTIGIDQTCPFRSDAARIRLILSHLLSNAIIFQRSENANKIIKLICSVTPSECSISIEDNGIGIEIDQCDEIFNLFYRATTQSQGAGIGLFVVHEALSKLKGTVAVNSQPDHGSVFNVLIPND